MSAARVAHEVTPYNEQGSFLLKMMLFRSDTKYAHLLFFIFIFALVCYRKITYLRFFFLVTVTAFSVYLILLLSAISYRQGDRLIMAAVPIWSILYPTVAYYTVKAVQKEIRLRSL
jgi:hypothetical protein